MQLQNLVSKIAKPISRFISKATIGVGNIAGSVQNTFNVATDYWNYKFGAVSARTLIRIGYGSNPIVFSVINKVAKNSAAITRIIESNNSMAQEIFDNPNEQQNRILFDMELSAYLNAAGEVFSRLIVGDIGHDWRIISPENMSIKVDSSGDLVRYEERRGNTIIKYAPKEIMHIKYGNILHTQGERRHRGLSPLEPGWKTVLASNEIYNAEASIFKHRGTIGLLSNDSGETMMPKARQAAQDHFNKETGGSEKFGSIYISNQKLRFQAMGMSPTDLKLIESQNDKLRGICTLYELSSILFNDPKNNTFKNMTTANVSGYNDVYIPHAEFIDLHKAKYMGEILQANVAIALDTTDIKILQAAAIEEPEPQLVSVV